MSVCVAILRARPEHAGEVEAIGRGRARGFAMPYVSGFVARFGELLVAEPQIEFAEELAGFIR
ncbi:hypothetical protein [Microbispora sp. GKU 823]|uniref:hypothetical protein n=1 Tax=Microbispora sp. GKU 823 TaxID=1652100 RepID=UPI0009A3A151|nr:hypothetical protein [Microbispora sp. GKU 823]OPG04521.1 hypothetical protein B1L11_37560 [Microbispora sp. GKU 823]